MSMVRSYAGGRLTF